MRSRAVKGLRWGWGKAKGLLSEKVRYRISGAALTILKKADRWYSNSSFYRLWVAKPGALSCGKSRRSWQDISRCRRISKVHLGAAREKRESHL